jgi:hypothetical protein
MDEWEADDGDGDGHSCWLFGVPPPAFSYRNRDPAQDRLSYQVRFEAK